MAISETLNFIVGTYLFVRSLFDALFDEAPEQCSKAQSVPGGRIPESLPAQLPSVLDVKRAIPPHCFKSSVGLSLYYAVRDILLIALTYTCLVYFATDHWLLEVPLVFLSWLIQGTLFMAVFVVGHDCGHGSFSDYPLLNDLVGTLLHAFLLVPYYPWKLSHRNHHRHTGNFDKDEVFYPVRQTHPNTGRKLLPGFGFGVGWYVYLVQGYRPRSITHFNPFTPMFMGHVTGCVCSLVAVSATLYLCYLYSCQHGLALLIVHYIVPLLLFGSYNVIITFLHHTDIRVPWYSDSRWEFLRGQLSTVDRHYGIVHGVIHNIGTHQIHHVFTKIPHYHLEEATVHFRRAFPQLVRISNEPILPLFVRMFKKFERQSVIVDEKTEVHLYE